MTHLSPSTSSRSLSPSSSNVSPAYYNTPLDTTMVNAPEEYDSSSSRSTPQRVSIDLPRTQAQSRGGCWTCRLRRKKCDEQREGDSCKTCLRLTIRCLGWGPRRPDWMRDKQAVDAYKADIKAQLTRAGLIRGQPRSSLLQGPMAFTRSSPATRPPPHHRNSMPNVTGFGLDSGPEYGYNFMESSMGGPPHIHVASGATGLPHQLFHNLPAASRSDPSINTIDIQPGHFSFDNYSPQSDPSPESGVSLDPSSFDIHGLGNIPNQLYDFEVRAPSPMGSFPIMAGTSSMQETHVMYYFEHVRKAQFIFAGNAVTNVTYSLILQEPRGAVTNAICALASLHYHRMRVSRGLEEPNVNPNVSNAHYFHTEAWYQLATSKSIRGHNESDAIAALHLVCYSQMSGGVTEWLQMFQTACEWLTSTGLATDENPMNVFRNMNEVAQLAVKMILWFDIFASPMALRTPRFAILFRRLFDSRGSLWGGIPGSDLEYSSNDSLRMESLTGCPDDAMLGFVEVSTIAFWKATQRRKGILSLRELIQKGDEIEKRLQHHELEHSSFLRKDESPLHPSLVGNISESDPHGIPNDEMRKIVSKIFRETVTLYLQVVVNDANPGVSEIQTCVNNIVSLFNQLPTSIADRALVLPICLAGCMTDDSIQRDVLKGRLQAQDETRGNVMKCRLLMEAVWQRRDINGGPVDWRDILQEREYNLLLI